MYVTDDEAARLALETVQQLAEIEHSFEVINAHADVLSAVEPMEENYVDSDNMENDLELKLVEYDSMENKDDNCIASKTDKLQENSVVLNEQEKGENRANSKKSDAALNNSTTNKENNSKLYSIFDTSSAQKQTKNNTEVTKNIKRSKAITTQVSKLIATYIENLCK